MPELPTGTVTFLFTDVEGSTRLWEEQPDAMRDALARHDEILLATVIEHDGYVVKQTGEQTEGKDGAGAADGGKETVAAKVKKDPLASDPQLSAALLLLRMQLAGAQM